MFSAAWKWVANNKWKSMAAVAIAGGYLWYRHTVVDYSEDDARKQRMTTYWRDSQLAADQTIAQFVKILNTEIEKHSRLTEVLTAIKKPGLESADRQRLFKELKIATFTSHLMFIYSLTFLACYMRVIVNVVGRHLFEAADDSGGPSVIDMIRNMLPNNIVFSALNGSEPELERMQDSNELLMLAADVRDRCLSSTSFFLQHGIPTLADVISQACTGTLDSRALDANLTLSEFMSIFEHIRSVIDAQLPRPYEGRPGNLIQNILLPPEDVSAYAFKDAEDALFSTGLQPQDKYRLLMNETRNVVESTAFQSLLQISLNDAFSLLADSFTTTITSVLTNAAKPQSEDQDANQVPPPLSSVTLPIAKHIAVLSNHFKVVSSPTDNLLVEKLTSSPIFNEFSYRVFRGPVRRNSE